MVPHGKQAGSRQRQPPSTVTVTVTAAAGVLGVGVARVAVGAHSHRQVVGGHRHTNVGRAGSSQNHRSNNQHPKVSTAGDNIFTTPIANVVPAFNFLFSNINW